MRLSTVCTQVYELNKTNYKNKSTHRDDVVRIGAEFADKKSCREFVSAFDDPDEGSRVFVAGTADRLHERRVHADVEPVEIKTIQLNYSSSQVVIIFQSS